MAEETIIEEGEGMEIPNIETEDHRLSLFEKLHEIADNQYEEDCIGNVERFVNLYLNNDMSHTASYDLKLHEFTTDIKGLDFEADAILEVMNILSKIDLQ